MAKTPTCDYCGECAVLVTGDVVMPKIHKVHLKHYWFCKPCDAWVACHENSPTLKPVGRLANADLRAAKRATHGAFDVLWMAGFLRQSRTRGDAASKSDCISVAYSWLAERMGLPAKVCHIGSFNVDQCNQAQQICENLGNELLKRY